MSTQNGSALAEIKIKFVKSFLQFVLTFIILLGFHLFMYPFKPLSVGVHMKLKTEICILTLKSPVMV